MRLATYRSGAQQRIGVIDAERELVFEVDVDAQASLLDVVERWETTRAQLRTVGNGLRLSSVELLAPLPRPARNIICVGKNYRDHSAEFARSGYDAAGAAGDADPGATAHPVFFTKAAGSVIGSDAPIDPHPELTRALDYEAELAVIIGRGGRHIAAERAWDHIWGYTIVNDVTARDLQRDHKQWFLGKSLDTFCPMGPWAVTADVVDATDLTVQCWVNGELRQKASTRDLIFDIPTLIATLASGVTLRPGDVIATGTPAGVGIGFNPPRFLASGDVVSMEISGLGRLTNAVGSRPRPHVGAGGN